MEQQKQQDELSRLIEERIKAMLQNGDLDRALAQNYGVRRRGHGHTDRPVKH